MLGSPHLTHSKQEMQTHRGMAFFAGTGPLGKKCGDCKFRGYQRERSTTANGNSVFYRSGGCAKFKHLSGKHGPEINGSWSACKYFEARDAKQA